MLFTMPHVNVVRVPAIDDVNSSAPCTGTKVALSDAPFRSTK